MPDKAGLRAVLDRYKWVGGFNHETPMYKSDSAKKIHSIDSMYTYICDSRTYIRNIHGAHVFYVQLDFFCVQENLFCVQYNFFLCSVKLFFVSSKTCYVFSNLPPANSLLHPSVPPKLPQSSGHHWC